MKPALALVILLLAGAARADGPPAVIDNEKLFGQKAVERVEQIAADLQTTYGIHLVIETMREAPGLEIEKHRSLKHDDFRRAAMERADTLGVHGMYVMITTSPAHVTVVAYPPSQELAEETSLYKR